MRIYPGAVPFLVVAIIAPMLITYMPIISLAPLALSIP